MANEMLYELANAILDAHRSGRTFRSYEGASDMIRIVAEGIGGGGVMIDASDVASHILIREGDQYQFDAQYFWSLFEGAAGDTVAKVRDRTTTWRDMRLPFGMPFENQLVFFMDRSFATPLPVAHLVSTRSENGLHRLLHYKYGFVLGDGGKLGLIVLKDYNDHTGHVALFHLYVAIALASISACTNAKLVECPQPSRATRRRHPSVAGVRFRTVSIDTEPKSRRRSSEEDSATGVAWHRRRGSIAWYTAERPLFGRFVGRKWRKATEVGDKKHGIIVQDYKVKPPEP